MGLAVDLRLRRRPEITAVLRRGRRVRAGGLVVHALERGDALVRSGGMERPGPRVAFVAPRTCGPAVRRNRTRRRVQEALRSMASTGIVADVDLVVRFLPAATEAGSDELTAWLTSALRTLSSRR